MGQKPFRKVSEALARSQMKDKLHIGKDKDDVGTATYNKAHGAESGEQAHFILSTFPQLPALLRRHNKQNFF